ncbi:MAG: indole-3-glycerol phosphate synthase TrpC [Anaerolineae bacterium]
MVIKTNTYLDKILAHKVEEVAAQRAQVPLAALEAQLAMVDAPRIPNLRRDTVTLIAEVKKASPSKGVLIEDFDPVVLGTAYAENGAAAISVLTDAQFFQGHLEHMRAVRTAVNVPVLRKDFVLEAYQVVEGRAAGADMMLLIAAALDDAQLHDLHQTMTELGMTPLVEVHDEVETERALKLGAALIGVNNRDLRTFEVDLDTTTRLARLMPETVTLVAESGIQSAGDVRRMGEVGAHAVLVGEALVKSGELGAAVRAFSSQPREHAR